MLRFVSLISVAVVGLTVSAQAQSDEQTLADIRQELTVLSVEMRRLNRELNTTGGVSSPSVGASVIDRVNAIEAELQRLTDRTEQLQFRIDRVVRDGTNRLDDLEFRVCEIDANCDIANWEPGATLGGDEPVTSGDGLAGTDTGVEEGSDFGDLNDGVQLAIGEEEDFKAAALALEEGNFPEAAAQLSAFMANYPGSPLMNDAQLLRGAALEGAGEDTEAARAYLQAFSADPSGEKAPEALYLLGRSLGRIGQTDEACVTLGEVSFRFPGGQAAADAEAERLRLACP